MSQTKTQKFLPILIILCTMLTACSSLNTATPQPSGTPTITPRPTKTLTLTPTVPTNTPTATPTPTLTPTPVQLAYETISAGNFDRLSLVKYLGPSGSVNFVKYSLDQQYIFLATDHEFCKYNAADLLLIDCFRLPNSMFEGGYHSIIVGMSQNQSFVYKFEIDLEPGHDFYILQMINPLTGQLIRTVDGNQNLDIEEKQFVCSTSIDNQDVVGLHNRKSVAFYGMEDSYPIVYDNHTFPETGCSDIVRGEKDIALVGNGGIDIYSDLDTLLVHLEGRKERVADISYSPNDKYLAVAFNPDKIYGTGSGLLVVYQTEDYLPIWENYSSGPIRDVAFSPDGQMIVYTSSGNNVNIYKTDTWEKSNTLLTNTNYGHEKIKFSPDSNYLIVSSGVPQRGTLRQQPYYVWDLRSGKSSPQYTIDYPDYNWRFSLFPIQADFSDTSNFLVYINRGDHLSIFDLASNKVVNFDELRPSSFQFTPDGKSLVIGTCRITAFDLTSGENYLLMKSQNPLTEECEWIYNIEFSPDDQQMAFIRRNWNLGFSIVSVIHIASGKVLFSEQISNSGPREAAKIAFSGDGKLLSVLSNSYNLSLYETENYTQVLEMENARGGELFSPDGKYLLGRISETVYAYDVSTCAEKSINSTRSRPGCGNILLIINYGDEKLQFFTDDTIITMGTLDYKDPDTYKLWSLSTGELTEIPLDYIPQTIDRKEEINNTIFNIPCIAREVIVSPEIGNLLINISNGNSGWALADTATGKYKYRDNDDFLDTSFTHRYSPEFDSFSPDGKFILSLDPPVLWAIK